MVERYQPRAAREAGHTCCQAAQEKKARYPDVAGRSVTPFCYETWGRLGDAGEALLQSLAAAAARYDYRRGHVTTGRLPRWRAQLDGALQKAVADAILASRFGTAGRAHRGQRPAASHAELGVYTGNRR